MELANADFFRTKQSPFPIFFGLLVRFCVNEDGNWWGVISIRELKALANEFSNSGRYYLRMYDGRHGEIQIDANERNESRLIFKGIGPIESRRKKLSRSLRFKKPRTKSPPLLLNEN
jgi:hypothetical protein